MLCGGKIDPELHQKVFNEIRLSLTGLIWGINSYDRSFMTTVEVDRFPAWLQSYQIVSNHCQRSLHPLSGSTFLLPHIFSSHIVFGRVDSSRSRCKDTNTVSQKFLSSGFVFLKIGCSWCHQHVIREDKFFPRGVLLKNCFCFIFYIQYQWCQWELSYSD